MCCLLTHFVARSCTWLPAISMSPSALLAAVPRLTMQRYPRFMHGCQAKQSSPRAVAQLGAQGDCRGLAVSKPATVGRQRLSSSLGLKQSNMWQAVCAVPRMRHPSFARLALANASTLSVRQCLSVRPASRVSRAQGCCSHLPLRANFMSGSALRFQARAP